MDEDFKFDKNILDAGELLKEFSGDREIIKSLISDFIDDLKTLMPLISGAISNKDFLLISGEAHKMKGCALSIFANKLGETFLNIELSAKKYDMAGIINFYNDLQNDFKIFAYYFKMIDKFFE